MNTQLAKHALLRSILCGAALAAGPKASAQTSPGLDLQLYAGLTITGAVGTVYSVEYVTNLFQADANNWHSLAFLQLPNKSYLWFDSTAPATGQRFYRATPFDAPTNLVFIPPGTFRMGSPTNELDRNPLNDPIGEGPQMAVTISQGFWMGKYEVTQGEYLAVMGTNPSLYNGDRSGEDPPYNQNYGIDLTRPVERVTWFNATNYCAKLTLREQTAGRIPVGSQFRLPTEAEWEYACRAGTSTRFSYGDDPGYTDLAQYAWYADDSGGTTHPAGQKLPNLWGLYDMSGNVWEWCQDRPAPYPGGIALDPQGPTTGADRLIRGGSFVGPGAGMRSAQRLHNPPTTTLGNTGFRVVLASGQP